MSITDSNKNELIAAGGTSGERWIDKEGEIKHVIRMPDGRIDGLLLTDQSTIRFPPLVSNEFSRQFVPGTKVHAAGPALGGQLNAHTLLLTELDTPLDVGHNKASSNAGASVAAGPLLPLQDQGVIQSVFYDPQGAVEGLFLSDGTTVRVPPHIRLEIPSNLEIGTEISVKGWGGQYPLGAAIQATSVTVIS